MGPASSSTTWSLVALEPSVCTGRAIEPAPPMERRSTHPRSLHHRLVHSIPRVEAHLPLPLGVRTVEGVALKKRRCTRPSVQALTHATGREGRSLRVCCRDASLVQREDGLGSASPQVLEHGARKAEEDERGGVQQHDCRSSREFTLKSTPQDQEGVSGRNRLSARRSSIDSRARAFDSPRRT
jgi:hypothetical protein